MKYRIYDTEAEAIAAEAQIAADMGCAIIGINASTGEPDPSAQATERWAIPQQIVDGRWVFQSPDETGVEWQSSWLPEIIPPEY